MAKIRVVGGTRSSTSKSLCDTCSMATRIQGMTDQQRIIKCAEANRIIPFNVEECNSYTEFGAASLYEMKQIATIIEIKGTQVGFYTAKKWRERRGDPEILGYED